MRKKEDVVVVNKQSQSLTQLSHKRKFITIRTTQTMNTKPTLVEGGNDLPETNQTQDGESLAREAENPKIERKWSPGK